MTAQDVMRIAREEDVRFIRLQFTDMFGTLKNVAITRSQLDKVLEEGCNFDGSSIEGFARIEESDMKLIPDPDTFVIFPWTDQGNRVARLICDVYTTDGKPFEGDPRYILKKTLAEAAQMGYSFNAGPECEFFLFQTGPGGEPTTHTHDKAEYFSLAPVDRGEDARQDICLALEEMGFEIEASHLENAAGQHEIDFRYDTALTTADKVMTFKLVVKTIAQRHGLHATFMPKPIYGIAGSGMHINQSLSKGGRNAFYDGDDPLGLSQEAYYYIGGLMAHAKGMAAITNPLINSYKRLVSGFEAPVYVAWATRNRSPLIRIPAARGQATRVELRNPDPSCNPYLAMACVLGAGLDGIRNKLLPPAPMECNLYEMSEAELGRAGVTKLPEDIAQAVEALRQDEVIMRVLGPHTSRCLPQAQLAQWDQYRIRVYDWELAEYLVRY